MNTRSRLSIAALGLLALMPFSLADTFPLEKLDLSLMSTEWGQPRANRSSDNNALRIGGEQFKNGVGTHANSAFLLKIDGNGTRFTAKVGVDDEVGPKGSVTFRVIGDDKELFNSGVMRGGDKAKPVDVDISGVQRLKLVADDAKDGNNSDHANWANAQIVMKSGSPVALPDGNFINIVSGASQLLLRIDAKGNLFQQFLGNTSAGNSVYTGGAKKDPAYPVINSSKEFQYWNDPALLIVHADGKNSNAFAYVSHETKEIKEGVTLTRILLKDRFYPVELTLCYQAYAQESIIEQWAEVKNNEPGTISLRQIDSAAIPFKAGKYWLTHFAGRWAGEFDVHEEQLTKGTKLVDSKYGITSSMIHEPHFLISLDAPSTEDSGRVLGASLAWSGNFRLSFEIDQDNRLYAHAGINPYLSAYPLASGETFRTPELLWTYSDRGRGEISRRFSRWARTERIKGGDQPGYVILNNWEATGFDVSEKRIIPQFPGGEEVGAELFLLDDGWFGTPEKARTLGDWDVSTKILPNGLEPLIKGCADHNMKFGYWVEMEMANSEAKVVADHPDWILADRNREDYLQRGQWVLDMSRPAVQDFAFSAFDKSLVDHPGVRYVKWDCNSSFHNPWSTYLGPQNQERLWVDYTRGLYNVMDKIAAKHPDIPMMACSGGGGRVDYGTMRYFNEFWASDNTDPLRRVKIQWGYSHFFPAKSISAHVTHWGHRPFKFAFDVAMSGRLGMDLDMLKLTDEEKFWAKQSIDLYKKRLRPVVQFGDLYRLESPYEGARASLLYSKDNAAVVFAYQVQDNADMTKQPLKLAGLDASRRYKIEEVNLPNGTASTCPQHGKTLTGASLMNDGLSLSLTKTFQSSVFVLTAE